MKLPSLPELTPSAVNPLLIDYEWPGNVRELENVIEREIILNRTGPLAFDTISGSPTAWRWSHLGEKRGPLTFNEISVRYITDALQKTGGVIHGANGAARLLGINPSTLRSRMKKLGISYKKVGMP